MGQTRQIGQAKQGRRPCNQATRQRPADRPLRSRPGSGLIEDDDARPIEIPDAFLDALAHRLASRLAEQMADQLTAPYEGSPWMTFEEAAEYTRVPAGTFRKLSADGTFTAHGGKRKIYHRHELDAALLSLPGRTRR
jgi:excisionase family DNA binding protein